MLKGREGEEKGTSVAGMGTRAGGILCLGVKEEVGNLGEVGSFIRKE